MGGRIGVLDLYEGKRVGDTNCTAEERNMIDISTAPSTEKTQDIKNINQLWKI